MLHFYCLFVCGISIRFCRLSSGFGTTWHSPLCYIQAARKISKWNLLKFCVHIARQENKRASRERKKNYKWHENNFVATQTEHEWAHKTIKTKPEPVKISEEHKHDDHWVRGREWAKRSDHFQWKDDTRKIFIISWWVFNSIRLGPRSRSSLKKTIIPVFGTFVVPWHALSR